MFKLQCTGLFIEVIFLICKNKKYVMFIAIEFKKMLHTFIKFRFV